jgi:hypothetical protein
VTPTDINDPGNPENKHRTRESQRQLRELLMTWDLNPSHPAARSITARYARVRAELADGLASLQAAGRVRPGVDATHLAATVLAVWDGLQLQWLLDPTVDAVTAFSAFLEQYVFPPAD